MLALSLVLPFAQRTPAPISVLGSDLLEWWSAASSPRSVSGSPFIWLTGFAAALVRARALRS